MSIHKFNLDNAQLTNNTLTDPTVKTNLHGFSTFYHNINNGKSDVYNIHSGWIRIKSNNNKLFSSKITWQNKWMELRNNSIIFFESKELKSPQQIYLLQTNLPIILPLDTLKVNDTTETLYPFQLFIVNRDAKNSKETETLATASEEERIMWIRCIKSSLFSNLGGGIFGQKLNLTLEFERRKNPDRKIPEIVDACINFIRSYGLKNQGLFRLTGKNSKLKLLEEMYDKGERPTLRPSNAPLITESNVTPIHLNKCDNKVNQYEEDNGVDENMCEDEVDNKCGRTNRFGSENSEPYLVVPFNYNKNFHMNRIHSSSSESQKDLNCLEKNLNHYPDDLITSGVDILNEKLDVCKEIENFGSMPVSKVKKLSVTRSNQLNFKKMQDISTGLRLSKSMDITRDNKKKKFNSKIKRIDSDDNLDNIDDCREKDNKIHLNRDMDNNIILIDVQTVASLLKSYLRQLPEPLIPFLSYEIVMTIVTRQLNIEREAAMLKLKDVLQQGLPTDNYNLIKHLCCFLHEVSLNAEFNKMNTENLAKIFCHSIISPELNDPDLLMLTSENRSMVAQVLIRNYEYLFENNNFSDEFNNCSKTSTKTIVDKKLSLTVDLDAKPITNNSNRFSLLTFEDLGINQLSSKLDLDFYNYSINGNDDLSSVDNKICKRLNINSFNDKYLDHYNANSDKIKCQLSSTSSDGSNKFDIVHDSIKMEDCVVNRQKSESLIDVSSMDFYPSVANACNNNCKENSIIVETPTNKRPTPNQLKYEFLRCVDSHKKNDFLDGSLMYRPIFPNECYDIFNQDEQLLHRNESRYKYNKPKNNLVVYTKMNKEDNLLGDNNTESVFDTEIKNPDKPDSSKGDQISDKIERCSNIISSSILDECNVPSLFIQDLNILSKDLLIEHCNQLQLSLTKKFQNLSSEIERLKLDNSNYIKQLEELKKDVDVLGQKDAEHLMEIEKERQITRQAVGRVVQLQNLLNRYILIYGEI